MKCFSFFIIGFFLTSCLSEKDGFDKTFFEKITLIKFPSKYKVLETFDNGEFLTGAVLQMDSLILQDFIIDNSFDSASNYVNTYMVSSEHYLKDNTPVFTTYTNLFYKRGSKKKTHWACVADLNNKKLWIEVSYPDWGGK